MFKYESFFLNLVNSRGQNQLIRVCTRTNFEIFSLEIKLCQTYKYKSGAFFLTQIYGQK
jgi:hypothetical protein